MYVFGPAHVKKCQGESAVRNFFFGNLIKVLDE